MGQKKSVILDEQGKLLPSDRDHRSGAAAAAARRHQPAAPAAAAAAPIASLPRCFNPSARCQKHLRQAASSPSSGHGQMDGWTDGAEGWMAWLLSISQPPCSVHTDTAKRKAVRCARQRAPLRSAAAPASLLAHSSQPAACPALPRCQLASEPPGQPATGLASPTRILWLRFRRRDCRRVRPRGILPRLVM